MNLSQQLQQLQQQVLQLLKKYQQVQKENVQLRKELDKSNALLVENNHLIQDLQRKIDVLKLGKAGWTPEEKIILEKRIDIYLKEIEKCLTLLNA